jgi:hypothetical protein
MGKPSEFITKPDALPRSVVGNDISVEDGGGVNPGIKETIIAVTTPIQLVRTIKVTVSIFNLRTSSLSNNFFSSLCQGFIDNVI